MSLSRAARFAARAAWLVAILGGSVGAQSAAPPGGSGGPAEFCGTTGDISDLLLDLNRAHDEASGGESSALGAGTARPFGDLLVLEDDGRLTFFGVTDSINIVRRFYTFFSDDFDFISIYNNFDAVPEFGFAFNAPVTNFTGGIGRRIVDTAESNRFPTARLGSYQNLNSLLQYPDQPRAVIPGLFNGLMDPVEVLAHEVAHQWLCELRLSGGDILGRDQLHWSFVLDSEASVMEGNLYRDNGDGTFTTVGALDTYSPLDQYAMGLRGRDDLPLQWVLENWTGPPDIVDDAEFPKLDVVITGTRRTFGASDLEAANGVRSPAAGQAQFVFHLGMILLVAEGAYPPSAADVRKTNAFRLDYETFFRQATEGRGFLLTSLCPPSPELRHRFVASSPAGARFGRALSASEDAGTDGDPDVLVGAPGDAGRAGSASLFDGRTGALVFRVTGGEAGAELGSAAAIVSDIDGIPGGDVVLGAPLAGAGAGRIEVRSGIDGHLIYPLTGDAPGDHLGAAVASLGDLNGDGRGDFAVSAPGAGSGAGIVRIVSGIDGSSLRLIAGQTSGAGFGESLSPAPDVDLDGRIDVLVGSPRFSPAPELASAGRAQIFSTIAGSSIRIVDGTNAGDLLGTSVATVPDLNGDSFDDVVLGAPGASAGRGAAILLSGLDGVGIRRLVGSAAGDLFGSSVAGLADVNGDGRGDVAAGAPGAMPRGFRSAGVALVFSGSDGALLTVASGESPQDSLGATVAASGRDNSSLLVSSLREAGGGVVRLHALHAFHLFSTGYPKRGRSLTFDVWGAPGEHYAIVPSSRSAPGMTPLPWPTGPGSASALDVGLEHAKITTGRAGFRGRLDGTGHASVSIVIPNHASLAGRRVALQAVSVNPTPGAAPKILRTSRPVELTIR